VVAWKNRIVGHGKVAVADLLFNPANWRIHPEEQQAFLRASLEQVGFVRSIMINQRTGNMVDGHARAVQADRDGVLELDAEFVDLSEAEELAVLATLDPIGELAEMDQGVYDELVARCGERNDELRSFMLDVAEREQGPGELPEGPTGAHHAPNGGEGAADEDSPGMKSINLVFEQADWESFRPDLEAMQARWDLPAAATVLRVVERADARTAAAIEN
jgi:hypothetical protein